MHPEDLMKPDLVSELVLMGSGGLAIRFPAADRSDRAYTNLTPASGFLGRMLCKQFTSVPF